MSTTRPARLPAGQRIYAVGDLHGRADLLQEVFEKIDRDISAFPASEVIEVFVGDYIDRGQSSADVIDLLVERSSIRKMVLLRGNHEVLMQRFFKEPAILAEWQQLGGLQTLLSYGIQPPINPTPEQQVELAIAFERSVPRSHRDFLDGLHPSFTCGDYFFVHAGVRPGTSLAKQKEEDLFWIRNDFLEYTGFFGKVIIHGHTPVKEPEIRSNRINIDTGAYATGRLTCLCLEDDQVYLI